MKAQCFFSKILCYSLSELYNPCTYQYFTLEHSFEISRKLQTNCKCKYIHTAEKRGNVVNKKEEVNEAIIFMK